MCLSPSIVAVRVPEEKKYTTSEKEAFAILKAVLYYYSFFAGFIVKTDHSAVGEILFTKQAIGRFERGISKLNKVKYTAMHLPGDTIEHAESLSRLPEAGNEEKNTEIPVGRERG